MIPCVNCVPPADGKHNDRRCFFDSTGPPLSHPDLRDTFLLGSCIHCRNSGGECEFAFPVKSKSGRTPEGEEAEMYSGKIALRLLPEPAAQPLTPEAFLGDPLRYCALVTGTWPNILPYRSATAFSWKEDSRGTPSADGGRELSRSDTLEDEGATRSGEETGGHTDEGSEEGPENAIPATVAISGGKDLLRPEGDEEKTASPAEPLSHDSEAVPPRSPESDHRSAKRRRVSLSSALPDPS